MPGFKDALRGLPHRAGADGCSACTLLEVWAHAITWVAADDPDFGHLLLTQSFGQINELQDQVESLKCPAAVLRLAKLLLRRARMRNGWPIVVLPYKRNLVATYLGLKAESPSRAPAKLRTHGVHNESEGVEISHPEALLKLIASDPADGWHRWA